MPFLQPSIEGEVFPAEDPWDWNVDQVVLALTDNNSPLLKNNSPLSLPDLALLANILRDNDVNGLALLTEVTGQSLRDEFGIKSMSHRASINHLVRLLQDQSKKYREHFVAFGRFPSFRGILGPVLYTLVHRNYTTHAPRRESQAFGRLP